MKIMQVMSGSRHGGAENFFVRLASALSNENVKQLAVIRKHQQRKDELEDKGIKVRELPFRGRFDLYTSYKLQADANSFMPDIVMSWMNRASIMAPTGKWQNVGRLGGYYNLKYYEKCRYLVCNTKDICDYVINHGRDAKNVWCIPNFVEEQQQAAVSRNEFKTPNSVPLVLAMGRLHKNKAFDVLIQAVEAVPEIFLWIAGEGPEESRLVQLANKLGLNERIRFLGWREDIAALHAAADIFVCSSRHEPLGNIILEAWAHKTPVIAARSQGPSQLIKHRSNGVLVDIDNPGVLADAIRLMVHDRALSAGMADEGYHAYVNGFSRDVIVNKYMEFYQQIL